MTKKLLFVLAAATALFFSCNKQEIEVIDTGITENVGLVVKVTIPKTKFAYTDEGASGLDLTLLNENDRLIAYFRNSGGTMIGSAVPMNLDPSTLSGDKKTGTFKAASPVEIPAAATSIFFYLDNEANGLYSLTDASIDNLKNQNGTLADVAKHQVIVGNATVASLGTDGSGNKVATITFEYKTSVLKLAITFPDGIVPTADENTTITLTDPDVYNSVRVAWGVPHGTEANNSKGAISVHPCSVAGQVATAYVTVWGGSEFTDATIIGKVGDITLPAEAFNAAGAAVAGKMHNVARTLSSIPNVDVWKTDAVQVIPFLSGLTVTTGDASLYNSATGEISLGANTTGSPLKTSLTFSNTSTVDVLQIGVDDFKGGWTFYAKTFAGANGLGLGSSNTKATSVTFGDPITTGTYTDEDSKKTITNNVGISGLFSTAIMDAAVIIDYANKKVEFGLFFDARTAQAAPGNNGSYPYVFFVPELGAYKSNAWFGTNTSYNFCVYPLGGTQNFGWIWFGVNETFDRLEYGTSSTYRWFWDLTGSGANSSYRYFVVGISVVASNAVTPSAETMKATNTNGSYEYIYQANYNGSASNGFYFTR